MIDRLTVAVVAGGPSAEAEVSRTSARGISAALERAGHVAELLELDASLAGALSERRPRVVFPIVHGLLGEDGCLQGLLEILEIPYVGSGVLASALAMHKPAAKAAFRDAKLPVAEEAVVRRGEDLDRLPHELRSRLGAAVVVKPVAAGSAVGVARVGADAPDEEVTTALGRALAVSDAALVEPMIHGREVTCGVLEDDDGSPRALPPTLILPRAADWYDFKSRYAVGGSEHRCPAPFSAALTSAVQELAVRAHRAVGARDLSRVDFVVGDDDTRGPVTLLEVNTLPGFTPTSLYPEAAAVAGISFDALCDRLVRRASARPRRARVEVLPMP